jgi:hypothetical protein
VGLGFEAERKKLQLQRPNSIVSFSDSITSCSCLPSIRSFVKIAAAHAHMIPTSVASKISYLATDKFDKFAS